MVECIFCPEAREDGKRQVLTEEKLRIFEANLNLSQCGTEFKIVNLEGSERFIRLDHETSCVQNGGNLDLQMDLLLSGGESTMRMFVDGVLEHERFQESLRGVDLAQSTSIGEVVDGLVRVLGAFSFETGKGFSCLVYLTIKRERFLVFGRDRLGESSLLLSAGSQGEEIIISNIESELLHFQENSQSVEIPVTGLFLLNLSSLEFEFYPWKVAPPYIDPRYWRKSDFQTLGSMEEDSAKLLESLRQVFSQEMEKRLTFEVFEDRAFVYMGMLFSGGLDSTVLLYLLLEWLFSNMDRLGDRIIRRFFPGEKTTGDLFDKDHLFFIVELMNASFSPAEAPDRLTGLSSYYEILELYESSLDTSKNVSIRFVCVDNAGDSLTREEKKILKCIAPCRTHLDFNIGGALFFALEGKGTLADKEGFKGDWWQEILSEAENSATWDGIFERKSPFSEANVETTRTDGPEKHPKDSNSQRKCQYCSFREHSKCQNKCCKSCCRKIQQNLIQPKGEGFPACRIHKMKIADYSKIPSTQRFINPQNYYLVDSSIDRVLFPKEKELVKDLVTSENNRLVYNARSRFLIVGSGADEFLGGYGRHITAKKHNGLEGIRREMLFDINRLWIRNQGRDYRLAMFYGKSLLAVFLQPSVISLVGELNFENICGSSFEATKPLLRLIASHLEIKLSSRFKKRAVQFGTRSSRQTNLKHFDSNRKATADAIFTPVNTL